MGPVTSLRSLLAYILLLHGLANESFATPMPVEDGHPNRTAVPAWVADTLTIPRIGNPVRTGSGPERRLVFSMRTEMDSNPFRMKDPWRDNFDGMRDDGERFAGYQSVSDQAVQASISGGLTWKSRTLREVGFDAGLGYRTFLRNGFADQFDVEAGFRVSASKGSRTSIDLDWTPSRFRANYVSESVAVTGFEPAHASDIGLRLKHQHRLSGAADLVGDAAIEWRNYEEAFAERDRRVLTGGLRLKLEPARRLRLEVGLSASRGTTTDEGALIDRSFGQVEGEAEISRRIGDWRPSLTIGVRRRSYTTTDESDQTRFGRVDSAWEIGVAATRPVARGIDLFIGARYREKRSNRPGDSLDPDVVPYTRYSLRLGFTATLRGG